MTTKHSPGDAQPRRRRRPPSLDVCGDERNRPSRKTKHASAVKLSDPQSANSNRAEDVPSVSPAQARELTTKRRGELAELAFTFKATGLGFAVSKPYGDSERYDFIVDSHEPDAMPKLYRVQVKCSTVLLDGQYHVNAHRRVNGRAVPYKLTEIDFIAAYVIPEDSWFIIPLHNILGVCSLLFRSKHDRKPGIYDGYREAWRLLREPDGIEIG